MKEEFYLYLGSAVVLVLIIALIMQLVCQTRVQITDSNKRYAVYVKTKEGLVASDNQTVADELTQSMDSIEKNRAVIQSTCVDMQPQIEQAIADLKKFIKDNPPEAEETLCSVDLHRDLIDNELQKSLTYETDDWQQSYKTLLEFEEQERQMSDSPRKSFEYLLKNLDIVIRLLRRNVCNRGRIDILKLQEIMESMAKRCGDVGIQFGYYPYSRYDRVPHVPFFNRDVRHIESFSGGKDSDGDKGKGSDGDKGKGSDGGKGSNQGKDSDKGKDSKLPFGPAIYQQEIKPESRLYTQYKQTKSKPVGWNSEFSIAPDDILSSGMASDDRLPTVGDYSEVYEQRPLADNSFEGSMDKDLLGYRPPGWLISQLHSPPAMYSVNANVCKGKTVPDDDLFKDCTGVEMDMTNALDGRPQGMLHCVDGNCNTADDYMKYYNQFPQSLKDSGFTLGNYLSD